MNRARKAALLTGTALGSVAVLAAPVAAQAAPTTPAAPSKAHTTIVGWGHNLSGDIPVAIHGHSITRHLTIAPGGVRTIEINDFTCTTTTGGQSKCQSKVIETLKTNSKGKITVTLPVHKNLDSYAVYVRGTKKASTAESIYWGVYQA